MRSWMIAACGLALLWAGTGAAWAAPADTQNPSIPFAPPVRADGPDSTDMLAPLEPITPPVHETFQQPAFQLIGDISAARLTGGGVEIEYDKVGFHAGVWTRFAVESFFQTGVGFTYSRAKGSPKLSFVTSTQRDVPVSSWTDIFEIAVPFGQTIWESHGAAYFSWSVGPAVFRVEEVTDIDFEILEGGLPTGETGHRKDKSVHYEPGADIRLGVKGVAGGVVPVGLNAGVSFIHWNPERGKPATLDWIETHTLVRYYAGVSVGYSSR